MNQIGIHESSGETYGGSSNWGALLEPQPLLLPISILNRDFSKEDYPQQRNLHAQTYILLADNYDPVSRTRSGKIYKQLNGTQPQTWHLGIPGSLIGPRQDLITWNKFYLPNELESFPANETIFAVGIGKGVTFWDLITYEESISGVFIIYLRARRSFGILPDIDLSKVDQSLAPLVEDKIEILLHDIHTANAESVVDSAREAVAVILDVFLRGEGHSTERKDLGKLITLCEKEKSKSIITSAAFIISRLHPRRKIIERESRGLRRIDERDAELAVNCVATIIKELRWTD